MCMCFCVFLQFFFLWVFVGFLVGSFDGFLYTFCGFWWFS